MNRRAHAGTNQPRTLFACLLSMAGMICSATNPSLAYAEPPKAVAGSGADILIFRDGRTLTGTILSETATSIKFKGVVSGIPFESEYDKKDILKTIKRDASAEPAPESKLAPVAATPEARTASPEPVTHAADGQKYYWIDLTGTFGEQITQTPLRDAIEDARKNNADCIIIMLDAEWRANPLEKLPDDTSNFDEIFRSEKLTEIFTEDIPKNWTTKKPRIVFWVKQAMAGAALLPLVCPEIYFAPEARLGGLGNLSFMFEGVGDDVVREKQRSLRLAHAEGWANAGGYDVRLIRAMARMEYVLSYRIVNGKAELFEGLPTSGNEFLLTDDGKEQNADTVQDRVAGVGNDVLTLKADTAYTIGVSKKTVETREELLSAMGLDRTGVFVKGRSAQIMKDWSNGLENVKRRLKKLRDDLGDVRVQAPGDFAARTKARGQRTKILTEMLGILEGRFSEGLTPRWLGQNQIPDVQSIKYALEQIKVEQLKDKK